MRNETYPGAAFDEALELNPFGPPQRSADDNRAGAETPAPAPPEKKKGRKDRRAYQTTAAKAALQEGPDERVRSRSASPAP